MSPTCSRVALRVLITVLLAGTIANAAALPHQLLDPRSPLAQDTTEALEAVPSAVKEDPGNFFENVSDDLQSKSAWQLVVDFFYRLFGPREDSNDDGEDSTTTTTVFVTPTPAEVTSSAAAEVTPTDIVFPPGPPTISTDISPSISSAEPSSAEVSSIKASSTTEVAPSDVFTILPVGPLSTAINASLLTPVFSTGPETSLPLLTPSAGIPPFPANAISSYDLPTAVPITDEFSVTIPVNLLSTGVPVPSAINSSAPARTGLPLPWAGNTTVSAINPTLILTNPIAPTPVINDTAALNTTSTTVSLTSVTFVTETIIPVPIGTGIAAPISASVGTDLPIAISASPIWLNSTYATPTILPGTGTGLPLPGTGIGLPLGTGSPSAGSALPSFSELPIYTNATNATAALPTEPLTSVVQIPITVTGLPGSVVDIDFTIPLPPFPNATTVASAIPVGSGTAAPSTGTGIALPLPGSEIPLFPNTTFTLVGPTTVPFPSGTGASLGTILPIASISESVLYPNTTTATITDLATETATAVLILPSAPAETDTAVQFPGLLALRAICRDPTIRVVTLPLINRFYGLSSYPFLFPFPGCVESNARQAFQAPGLLNCSVLGAEVQRCQAGGKKVLLSVKAHGLNVVSDNAQFGDPSAPDQPFGAYFGAEGGLDKRQVLGPRLVIGTPLGVPWTAPIATPIEAAVNSALPASVRNSILAPIKSLIPSPIESLILAPIESLLAIPIQTPVVAPIETQNLPFIPSAVAGPIETPVSVPVESPILPSPETLYDAPIATPILLPIATPILIPVETPSLARFEVSTPLPLETPESPTDLPDLVPIIDLPPIFTPLETPNSEPVIPTDAPIETPTPISEPIFPSNPFDILNPTIPMGHGPVILNATEPTPIPLAPIPLNITNPGPIFLNDSPPTPDVDATPVIVVEPNPIIPFPDSNPSAQISAFPSLFSANHPPGALALTLFSLFGEGHTERADLRPLGPDAPSGASPAPLNGTDWVNPILTALQRPLGEEVVVDGFDVQVPAE
ncbi:hypothetical protein EK21DRAFT_109427 [Setomelanomma holmii]|uniref:Uncharacterized protein n=1 Tax=Setomelanomma holmii TaxID=210430 RepID=A0A9P4LPB1_9PLEO|nr:hypothetical protein EK21DRAFT_109427 [Setomelanomma holmii]